MINSAVFKIGTRLSVLCLLVLALLPLTGCSIRKQSDPAHQEAVREDNASRAFVDKVVPEITQNWDSEALTRYANWRLQASPTAKTQSALFHQFNHKLGNLKRYGGAVGEARWRKFKTGRFLMATYHVTAEYENDLASITVKLIKEKDRWEILFFQVDAEALRM